MPVGWLLWFAYVTTRAINFDWKGIIAWAWLVFVPISFFGFRLLDFGEGQALALSAPIVLGVSVLGYVVRGIFLLLDRRG